MYSGFNKIIYVCKLQALDYTFRSCITPENKKLLKRQPKDVAKRYVKTYSSSDTATRKRIQYNTIQYFIDTPLVGLFSDNATNKHTY